MPGVSSAGCPQQRYATGEPDKVPGWIVEGSCGYQAHGFSIREKFVLSRNLGYKTTRVFMWLNIVMTPGSLLRSQSSGTGLSAS